MEDINSKPYKENITETVKDPRKVMLTTDGKVLVSGENGIVEITDPDFLRYITRGMTVKEVELDGPAEFTADRAYEQASKTRLGPVEPPYVPHKETMDISSKISSIDGSSDFVEPADTDAVDHPKHYNSHPSGIECIVIARWYDFAIGNAIKYLWRHGLKSEEGKEDIDKAIEDLEKAIWYIKDEILTLEQKKDMQTKSS